MKYFSHNTSTNEASYIAHLHVALQAQLWQELKLAPSIDGEHFSEEVAVHPTASWQSQPAVQQVVSGQLEEVGCVGEHPNLSET